MKRRDFVLGAAALVALPSVAAPANELWTALRSGGVALLLRHAQTEAGIGDPPGFRLDACSTQRNLSVEGRQQSARIGAALTAQRVRFDHVLSSQWCRCLDTARLAFPGAMVEPFTPLNSFFDRAADEPGQTRAVVARIAMIPPGSAIACVTHHVNIAALSGENVSAGEGVVVRLAGASVRVLGRLAL